jgi:hypothetical protein
MDDRIRVSDADRDQVTALLRDHFAAGRLTSAELDERLSAALNAKTVGDLRRVMADLPGQVPATAQQAARPPWAEPGRVPRRHRPRLLPLALVALLLALLFPGGWAALAFFKLLLVFWLVSCVVGMFAGARARRRMRRQRPGYPWRGPGYPRW